MKSYIGGHIARTYINSRSGLSLIAYLHLRDFCGSTTVKFLSHLGR